MRRHGEEGLSDQASLAPAVREGSGQGAARKNTTGGAAVAGARELGDATDGRRARAKSATIQVRLAEQDLDRRQTREAVLRRQRGLLRSVLKPPLAFHTTRRQRLIAPVRSPDAPTDTCDPSLGPQDAESETMACWKGRTLAARSHVLVRLKQQLPDHGDDLIDGCDAVDQLQVGGVDHEFTVEGLEQVLPIRTHHNEEG